MVVILQDRRHPGRRGPLPAGILLPDAETSSLRRVMTADDVLFVLTLLQRAEADVWVDAGWGTDALIGEQTRDHRDLGLMHRQDQEGVVLAALSAAGFVESLNWRLIRFVVTAPDGREIDLHPLVFSDDGSAVQASLEPQRPFCLSLLLPRDGNHPADVCPMLVRRAAGLLPPGIRTNGTRSARYGRTSPHLRDRHALLIRFQAVSKITDMLAFTKHELMSELIGMRCCLSST